MRIVKTKVYRLSELTEEMQAKAIENEAIRFAKFFATKYKGYVNEHELTAAKERISKFKYEFTKDGKVFTK